MMAPKPLPMCSSDVLLISLENVRSGQERGLNAFSALLVFMAQEISWENLGNSPPEHWDQPGSGKGSYAYAVITRVV